MTISSILSNLPVLKTLQTGATPKTDTDKPVSASEASATEDVVAISSEALQKLEQQDAARELPSDDLGKVRNFAQETAELVAKNQDYPLGLDPAFAPDV